MQSTAAYGIITGDRRSERLSHAYMLHFQDVKNLRKALGLFAIAFYGAVGGEKDRILSGNHPDVIFAPAEGQKLTADAVSAIVGDSMLRPVEKDRKLYVICGFDGASPLLQNKLLKTLEEPLEGIHFLLGAASLSPVLDTVISRVKLLEIPPFLENEIFAALEREGANPLNAAAARSANGILGAAENMVGGGWFEDVARAAREICFNTGTENIGRLAAEYGETKYKTELLAEMQRLYFTALAEGGELRDVLSAPTLIYALERLGGANADVKFNANFHGLLYDFMLGVAKENKKWRKLRG